MFGRKKPVDISEFEKIKADIDKQEKGKELVTITPDPKPPMSNIILVPETKFSIVKKTTKLVDKFVYSQSGQQIRTGEQEQMETLEPVCDMSLDDLLRISFFTSSLGKRIRSEIAKDLA